MGQIIKLSTGAELHVEVHPNLLPENTVFLHGNLASNNWWKPSLAVWSERAKGSAWMGSMILVEFRGCGSSKAPASKEEMKMPLLAEDLTELVRSQNWGPVNLVGHSTGGLICALAAASQPQQFKKLVLLDPVGVKGVQFEDSMYEAFDKMKQDRELTAAVIGSTIYQSNSEDPLLKDYLVDDAWKAVKSVGMWVLEALKAADFSESLIAQRKPALVLHGEFDNLLPLQDSKQMALLMNADFQVMKDCGHCGNVEKPNYFVEITHSFLFA